MSMDLYGSLLSAPCRSVLLTAKVLNLKLNLKHVNVMKDETLKPEFLKLNPQHTIPTLVDNNFSIWESRAIMTYLVNRYGRNDSLYPKEARARALVDQRLYFDMGTLFQRFADYFYATFEGPVDDKKKEKIDEALQFLNGFLESSTFVAGNNLTVADCTIVASISTMEAIGIDVNKYPNIKVWYEKVKTVIPGYQEINVKGIQELKMALEEFRKNKEKQ